MEVEDARKALLSLQEVERTQDTYAAVIVDTIGPELRVTPAATEQQVQFAEGAAVTLTRAAGATLSPTTVPVQCEVPFSELKLAPGASLSISTYLSTGTAPLPCRLGDVAALVLLDPCLTSCQPVLEPAMRDRMSSSLVSPLFSSLFAFLCYSPACQ